MDLFSSLSLARSTIQLIEFGSNLLSGTYEIYHSQDGRTRNDAELGARTAILHKLASSLANRSSSHVTDTSSQTIPSQPNAAPDANSVLLEAKAESATDATQEKTPREDESPQAGIQFLDREEEKNVIFNNKFEIEQAYKRLQKLTSEVKSNSMAFTAEDVQRSTQEQNLKKVAMGCQVVAKKLETTLGQLRLDPKNTKYRRFASFRQAFVKLCSQKKIDGMEKTLDKYKTDLILQLAVIMSDKQSSVIGDFRMLRDASSRLGSAYEEHLDNIAKSFKLIQAQIENDPQLAQRNLRNHTYAVEDQDEVEGKRFGLFSPHKYHGPSSIKITASQSHSSLTIEERNSQAIQYLAETLNSLVLTATDVTVAQRVLNGLRYDVMTMRMESVAEAHTNTYEWIFEPRTAVDTKGIEVRFSEWLAEKEGIFWVSGKPGSGKSTLMKFICEHRRTREALENWAQPLNPVMSTHFFWSSGTTMQKSQEGLFRSLLYDVFKKSPKVIKIACPQRWEASRGRESDLEPWTLSELRRTLTSLATCDELGYKFCFFIDGLDEYEGDHLEIIDLLRSLATSPHIKLCVSSRSWNVFEDAYGKHDGRKLCLQDLTSQDIYHYVQKRLEEHPNWQIVPSEQPLYQSLLEEVTTKAQGVFLWVYLVVRSLYEGLTNGDSLSALERRARDLPAHLESFFTHMLDSVDPFYHVQMAMAFQVAMSSLKQLPLMIYYFLDENFENPNFALLTPVNSMPMLEVVRRQEQVRRQLNGRCKGLLEVRKMSGKGQYASHVVDFLHRTVRDFLKTKEMSDFLAAKARSHVEPNTLVFKSFVALIKSIPHEEFDMAGYGSVSRILGNAIHYAYKAELASGKAQPELLDDLDRTLKFYAATSGKPIPWYRRYHAPPNAGDGYTPCQTFLEFAIQNGLCLYVKHQLSLKYQPLDVKQPLLKCAVAHLLVYSVEEPDLTDMVRLLLDQGQLPMSELLNNEVWNSLIMSFVNFIRHGNYYSRAPFDEVKHRQGIIEMLLAHGVDPNTCTKGTTPAWYELLVATLSESFDIPTSVYPIMVQIFKSILSAGANLSGYQWKASDIFIQILYSKQDTSNLETGDSYQDYLCQLFCLLISNGMELTESQKYIIEQRFLPRLAALIFTAINEQNQETKVQTTVDNQRSWKWVSWLGLQR